MTDKINDNLIDINDNVNNNNDNNDKFSDLLDTIKTDWGDYIKEYITPSMIEEINYNYESDDTYPLYNNMFSCFNYFNIKDTKVVILGQDPYYKKGQANGLAFSVNSDCKVPPSLRNIYKELSIEYPDKSKSYFLNQGNLVSWAEQGVMLLNTALTVKDSKPNSHKKLWVGFSNKIIELISNECDSCVFLLWGNNAKSKEKFIDTKKHLVIKTCHPSPLSANKSNADWFYSCQFKKVNKYLESKNKTEIDWIP